MKPTLIQLSTRDFALTSPRSGSIEHHSGLSRAAEDGIEIHQRVQAQRLQDDPRYEVEVKTRHLFEVDPFQIEVTGRMDGVRRSLPPGRTQIEEIKSTFQIDPLIKRLHPQHPYVLQLRTYGYFHWLQNGEIPELNLHLVSTRNFTSQDYRVELDLETYEEWLKLRLREIAVHAERQILQKERRKSVADTLVFPFKSPRKGQRELIASVEECLLNKNKILIQAPTGLGKTVGVLFPTLKNSFQRGSSVHYVTPKNSQHSVAEEAVSKITESSPLSVTHPIRSLTLTAKSKICFQPEPLCDPELCAYSKDYYDKFHVSGLQQILDREKKLSRATFETIGKAHEVCPYQLQLDSIGIADVVICDYHYALTPQSPLFIGGDPDQKLRFESMEDQPNLILDEVHNLPSRGMDMHSPSLSSRFYRQLQQNLENPAPSSSAKKRGKRRKKLTKLQKEGATLLEECSEILMSSAPHLPPSELKKGIRFQPDLAPFIEQNTKLRAYLVRYLESDLEIQSQDPILKGCYTWADFSEKLQFLALAPSETAQNFFITYRQDTTTDAKIQICCVDPSEFIRPRFKDYQSTIAFSATVKPFDFYANLSGLSGDDLTLREFTSPFEPQNRKVILIPQVSTKFTNRDQSAPRISEIIQRIVPLRPGNYFVFFPSFAYLEKVSQIFQPPEGFRLICQVREMSPRDIEETLLNLKNHQSPTLVFAVQGGVFSEGIDTPGEMIIGAFIVGPPLPHFDLEREEMRRLYEKKTPGKGFDYAYTFPAMAKAVQAAGRVIRTETDRGLIVLIDDRFQNPSYAQCMPTDWFKQSPRELVSTAILKEIREFWEKSD